MLPRQYLDFIRDDGARLLASAEAAGLDAAVPSCPDWTVADLLVHVGRVQRWQADIVSRRVQEAEFVFAEPPGDPAALVPWVQDATALAIEVFAASSPDTPVWTFAGPGTASFWFRRQAHELAMHRTDADLAAGLRPGVDQDLAHDGIDEFLSMVVGSRLRDRFVADGGSVHLHRTDGDGEWLVRLTPDGPVLTREHGKGDVAARGTASDLLLVLRGRVGLDAVEVYGDAALLAGFVDRATI